MNHFPGIDKPRVLIIRSNPIAPDPRVEKIARALIHAGYPVQAICWDRSAQLNNHEVYQDFSINRLPIQAKYGNGLGNLPALLRWQFGLLNWLSKNRDHFDIIHACDFDTILPALYCKTFFSKIIVYDIFDFYADHLRRTPTWIKHLIRSMDYFAIRRADSVILVDDARMDQIAGSHPKKCVSIYNSPEDVIGSTGNLPATSPKGELIVTYVGLLQVERGIFEVLNVFRNHPNWHLHLAGFGGDEARIVSIAKELPNVSWHGRIPYPSAIELSDQADVLFATYDPSIPNHRYSSPNKVFEGMMLGKPIIVAHDTNMDRMIMDANCGLTVSYGDTNELEEAFIKLANDPDLRLLLGGNARRAYEETYSWEKMEYRLVNLYQEICASGKKDHETR